MNENRKPFLSFLIGLLTGLVIAGIGVIFVLHGINKAIHKRIQVLPSVSYQPEVPISFSHSVHSGKAQIDCAYCHGGARADRSDFQQVPGVEVCRNCHDTDVGLK